MSEEQRQHEHAWYWSQRTAGGVWFVRCRCGTSFIPPDGPLEGYRYTGAIPLHIAGPIPESLQ